MCKIMCAIFFIDFIKSKFALTFRTFPKFFLVLKSIAIERTSITMITKSAIVWLHLVPPCFVVLFRAAHDLIGESMADVLKPFIEWLFRHVSLCALIAQAMDCFQARDRAHHDGKLPFELWNLNVRAVRLVVVSLHEGGLIEKIQPFG